MEEYGYMIMWVIALVTYRYYTYWKKGDNNFIYNRYDNSGHSYHYACLERKENKIMEATMMNIAIHLMKQKNLSTFKIGKQLTDISTRYPIVILRVKMKLSVETYTLLCN